MGTTVRCWQSRRQDRVAKNKGKTRKGAGPEGEVGTVPYLTSTEVARDGSLGRKGSA